MHGRLLVCVLPKYTAALFEQDTESHFWTW